MPERAEMWAWRDRRVKEIAGAATAMVALGFSCACYGQDVERRVESRLRRQDELGNIQRDPTLSFSERTTRELGGFQSFTYLSLKDNEGNTRGLVQNDTTLFGRASFDGVHSLFGRLRFRHQDFTTGDSFDMRGDRWREPYLDRYWYELSARDLLGNLREEAGDDSLPTTLNLNVRAGRQFVDWGAGLSLSEVLLSVRPTVVVAGSLSIEGLAGVTPPDESVIDFDTSRRQYNQRTKRGYFGLMARGQTNWGEIYTGILWSVDYNTDNEPRLPIGTTDFDYNAVYLNLGVNGSVGTNFLYETELVYEGGSSMSDPLRTSQTRESIQAFAARGEATYLFRDAGLSRAQMEVLVASGDRDRLVPTDTVGGNLSGTNDNAFNSLGFANTGLAFGSSLNNLVSLRLGASMFPFRDQRDLSQLQIGADVFVFGKFHAAAPIEEPTYARSFLGVETDVYMNYRVTSDLGISIRYGAFMPGSAISGQKDTRHFLLLSVTLSF
ncbi:MAG: alginate export family protein [Pyrinomonadaceae bacterium]|nr:alginate export family protein [Phycisphaerales bacterium]